MLMGTAICINEHKSVGRLNELRKIGKDDYGT